MNFDHKIKITEIAVNEPNLTGRLSERDRQTLGEYIWDGYTIDRNSRTNWERRTNAALDLALQVTRDKNSPWAGCSNVAFPLVTIAALQFQSRSAPLLIQGPNIARMRVVGDDPQGLKQAVARKVGEDLSWQMLEQDSAWEEQHNRLLMQVPIVGTAFKKIYQSGSRHVVGDLVSAQDLVVNYYAKSLEKAVRKTHRTYLYRNDVYERVKSGRFADILDDAWYNSDAMYSSYDNSNRDKRTGLEEPTSDHDSPFCFLECHTFLDLDQDGYAEPYIATIEEGSKTLVRLVYRFPNMDMVERLRNGEIVRIIPEEMFVKYGFIPSPDGSILDIGFGVLLGPINESVSSIINQLIDAGTLANTAGGFLGRGAKFRGGPNSFDPFGWNRVDATGEDIKSSIFPLPVREPSAVLFNALSLLIEYANRIPGSTDMLAGQNPGQNTPAQTSQTMVEQGQKVYASLFKTHWRSLKSEMELWYKLNGIHRHDEMRQLYLLDAKHIVPVADPNVVSDTVRVQQALAVKNSAMVTPGYSIPDVEKNLLYAMRVESIDVLYPGPDKVPPLPNPKMKVEEMKLQMAAMEAEHENKRFALSLMEERRLNTAKIMELKAKMGKLLAEAGDIEKSREIDTYRMALDTLAEHNDTINERLKMMMEGERDAANKPGGMGPNASQSGGQGAPAGGGGAGPVPQGPMGGGGT